MMKAFRATFRVILQAAAIAAVSITTHAAQLEIDPQQSKVEVAVSSTMDSFVGYLEKYQANVECDPAAVLPARADVSFDFADLKTGNSDRDKEMLKWLDYASHRTVSFHLVGWNQSGTTNIAKGELTIHGVKKSVQMPVVIKQGNATWDISGQALIDYRDFNLPKIRKALILTVNPKLIVRFHLVGKSIPPK